MGFSLRKLTQANNTQDASWGNRHVGDSVYGGRPSNAVQFVGEGNLAVFKKKEKRFTEPLDPAMKAHGVTEEDWSIIQQGLRDAWRVISKRKFKAKIEELNETFFSQHSLIAVYAEYGGKGGQKAMTVYTQDAWNSLPTSSSKTRPTSK